MDAIATMAFQVATGDGRNCGGSTTPLADSAHQPTTGPTIDAVARIARVRRDNGVRGRRRAGTGRAARRLGSAVQPDRAGASVVTVLTPWPP
ncbi:hypothetical protein GCM10009682_43940 [Luedemannella flava]|uniref:Uncharacterized protein n=1 Tax=Luedemannella flava TaxID=349316 RepID=A0ABN2MBA0_9ACTN